MYVIAHPIIFNSQQREWIESLNMLEVSLPIRCPHCSAVGEPYLTSLVKNPDIEGLFEALYYCRNCRGFFRVSYSEFGSNPLVVMKVHGSANKEEFSAALYALSPSFIKTFEESEIGEATKLISIAGPGYRKALEHLVKDFAVFQHPENEEEIKGAPLMQVINKYINHPRIKTLAKGSTWLGNDQTHTVQKHEDYSLNDLKHFIIAVAKYIDLELTVEEAQNLLESPK